MLYDAKNGSIQIEDTEMDYITFGNGTTPIILIPGLGEGLKTVEGTALPFALLYHDVAKDYRVYVFSRRNILPSGFTTKDMAEDVYFAMQSLKIPKANVVGISLGGMIAEYLALKHPEAVEKLVLTVTIARQNEVVQQKIRTWIEMAEQGDYKGIMIDTAESSYSEKYLKKARRMCRLLGNAGKPKSFDRFLTMAEAGLRHDAYEELKQLTCPTLVIGGAQDKIVSGAASVELAEQIPGSSLYMYEEYGHGLYEEAEDFLSRVLDFFQRDCMESVRFYL